MPLTTGNLHHREGGERTRDDDIRGNPDLLTIRELSEAFGYSRDYLRTLAREGWIPAFQLGKSRWLIPRRQLVDWLEEGGGGNRRLTKK